MNRETAAFVNSKGLRDLDKKLSARHSAKKPTYGHDRLAALGLAIARFQRLEFTLGQLVWVLLDVDQNAAQILTSGLSFKAVLDAISALAVQRQFTQPDDLQQLLTLARMAETIRNQLVHSVWTSGPRMKVKTDRKKGFAVMFEDYSKEDLEAIADAIDRLDSSFSALKFNYINEKLAGGM